MNRTIDEALERFDLIAGKGDGLRTACAMTALSWVAGEAWTVSPECAHHLLPSLVIAANDHSDTSPEQRAEMVRAGESGLIDTWWLPDAVVIGCLAESRHEDPVTEALDTLMLIAWWKVDKRRANLSRANLSGTPLYGANLSRANLSGTPLYGANHDDFTVWPSGFDKGRLA